MRGASKIAGRAGEIPTRWPGIQPGDIGWDEGGGIVGFGIRLFTLGAYAHCFVYVGKLANGNYQTVEAYPGGVKLREREPWRVYRVLRLWNSEDGQKRIIDEALSHVGRRYGYGEILAIALNRLGIKVNAPDNPETMICSNSVARAAIAGDARVAEFLTRTPDRIWPARLERDLNVASWVFNIRGGDDSEE